MLKEEIPDKHIKNGLSHYSGKNWRIEKSIEQFRVKYVGLGLGGFFIVFFSFLILAVFLYNLIEPKPLNIVASIFVFIIGIIILFTVNSLNKKSISKGDWLIYDLSSGIVNLPRIPVSLKKDDIKLIQVIVGVPECGSASMTEVNLVVYRESGYERYPLVRVDPSNCAKGLVLELSELLSVDIQKVKYSLSGKKTITNGW